MMLLLLLALTQAAIKDHVIYAINCGSTDGFADEYGIEYTKDRFFTGGKPSDFGEQYEYSWESIPDKNVFLTERYSTTDLTYKIPLKQGKYVVNLKFSEVYFEQPNMKVFDVKLGNEVVIRNLDIYAKVGKFKALDEFIEIEITESGIKYHNKVISSGYVSGELIITMAKGEQDNPKINGIVVFEGGLENTYYEEKQKYLQSKANEEREKRKTEKAKSIGIIEENSQSKLEKLGPQSKIPGAFYNEPIEDQLKSSIRAFLDFNWGMEMVCCGITVLVFILVVLKWKKD